MSRSTVGVAAEQTSTIEEQITLHSAAITAKMADCVREARNEADIRHEFYALVRQFLYDTRLSLTIRALNEYALAGGRVDAKYGGVIIEYKNPNSAADRIDPTLDAPSTQRLVKQIMDRFNDFANAERVDQKRLFGCGTDGRRILYVRNRSGRFEIDDPQPLTPETVARLLRALISLGASGTSFIPTNLCADFGASSLVAQHAVSALYDAIRTTDDAKAKMLFDQWRLLFSEVCGYKVTEANDAVDELAESFGIATPNSAAFLFALHTYYSIFIKLLSSEIVSAFSTFTTSVVQRCVAAPTNNRLYREFLTLEEGANWRVWGVSNFLEGDLFSWYLSGWTSELATALRELAQKADEYDPATLSVDPGESHDLLKVLYQNLIPQKTRHDLGEYYTPDWLASRVLDLVGYDGNPDTRILDPGCGSGTFLVEIVNRIRSWFAEHRHECGYSEETLVQKILTNVVGFDLNPLAVMASRVNYLLVIRDLIKHTHHIELPVFLSDSILTPSAFGELFEDIARLKTTVGEFLIPAEVARSSEDIAKYTEIMELCIEAKANVDVFVHQVRDAALSLDNLNPHQELYAKMLQLDAERRNGIWARVIKNSFAPIFAKKFDFIVGNPPWINWQHLPREYRTDLIRVWRKYGLLSLSGAAGRLGGGKKDLSMLFTYVAVDQYLNEGGRLAFLITQSVFKTKGAGDGFRRFRYESGNRSMYIRPIEVDDLSAIQVFTGATNKTSLLVVEKSRQPFSYPVPYRIWKGPGRIAQDATPAEATERIAIHDIAAAPVLGGRGTSPWLTVPSEALPACRRVLGRSAYTAMAGCTTWLNGVYWVEVLENRGTEIIIQNLNNIGKTKGIEKVQARIESELLFPLLRGEDVFRWKAAPSLEIILPQDPEAREGIPEEEMERKFRMTLRYLRKFEPRLRKRSGYIKYFHSEGPFYSIYNVSKSTFSPHKVVWRDMGSVMQTAVISKDDLRDIVPEHHVMFISTNAAEEAHFICAILNSAPVCLTVAGYTTTTGMSTHVASTIALPRFAARNRTHRELADLSAECHAAASDDDADRVSDLELQIDEKVGELYGFTSGQLAASRKGLELFR